MKQLEMTHMELEDLKSSVGGNYDTPAHKAVWCFSTMIAHYGRASRMRPGLDFEQYALAWIKAQKERGDHPEFTLDALDILSALIKGESSYWIKPGYSYVGDFGEHGRIGI